jgi:hypothetical protein
MTPNGPGYSIALARLLGGATAVTSQAAVASQLNQLITETNQSLQPDQVTFQASAQADVDTVIAAVNALPEATTAVTVTLDLGGGTYSTNGVAVNPPPNVKFVVKNGTLDPSYPALRVAGGNVTVVNCTLLTTGDAPTILITGGSLTLRNDNIQESSGFTDAAISLTGGTLDLGTSGNTGGNVINVNGTGTFISNTTANPVSAVGDTFEINRQATAWPIALNVTANSSLMQAGKNPPPLTGSVNGAPFTSPFQYITPFGDTITLTLSTTATCASPMGQYPITASLSGASADNYTLVPSYGTMYVVSVGADPTDPTHVESVSFWDNKGNARVITAADLSSLDALNLVNQGGAAFDPHSVAQLQAWLSTSPNATAADQLAVQLAAMDLNVLTGYVKASDLVFAGGLLPYASADNIPGLTSGGFIDVQYLMQAANAALGQVSPGAPANDPNATYELALATVLQNANANTDFVLQELQWNLLALYPSFPPAT